MTSTRDSYRQALEGFATAAKAILPASHGRIESAVALVLAGDVEICADGTALVGSATAPATKYSVNGSCPCQDYPRAPEGWCKHRIARGLAIRAQRAVAAALDAPAPVEAPPEPSQVPDATTAPQDAPRGQVHTGLPDVPAIATINVMIRGREVQLKLCDRDDGALLARLETVLTRYPEVPPSAAPRVPRGNASSNPRCPAHPQRTMKEFPSKPGKYHCTYRDEVTGVYCTERA